MDSTTTIQPLRSSYITTRTINNVEGLSVRRHLSEVDSIIHEKVNAEQKMFKSLYNSKKHDQRIQKRENL